MTVRIKEIVESEYGEKAIIDISYDHRHYVQVLPWGDGQHGEAGVPQSDRVPDFIGEDAESYDWPDDYEAHQNWNGDNWEIDVDALDEAISFWKAQDFNIELATDIDVTV